MRLARKMRFLKDLAGVRLFGRKKLLYVAIESTKRCNFNCAFCKCNSLAKRELTLEQIKAFFRQCPDIAIVDISGGEPLLRKDIGQIIDFLKQDDKFVILRTNGSLIDKRFNDILNADIFVISIDGLEKDNDRQRSKGSFRRSIKGMEMLLSAGKKVFVATTVTKHNYLGLDTFLKFIGKYDVRVFLQDVFENFNTPRGVKSCLETAAMAEYFLENAASISANRQIRTSLRSIIGMGAKRVPLFNKCYYTRMSAFLNSNGELYNCRILNDRKDVLPLENSVLKRQPLDIFRALPEQECRSCPFTSVNDFNMSLSSLSGLAGQIKRLRS